MVTTRKCAARRQATIVPRPALIESDQFPFEFLSELGGRESWRKEIHRPIYHLHKWWATRLGSVFRGLILGCVLPVEAQLAEAFYQRHSFEGLTVFDPFMGSGTTVGEAHKLGCAALGRDINPVAAESVRVSFGPMNPQLIQAAFRKLEKTVGSRIRDLYQTTDEHGLPCEVLYYFWVKQVPCAHCGVDVDLFKSRIIARNAFPDRKPEVRVSCPGCAAIFTAKIDDISVNCRSCGRRFNPKDGNTQRANANCPACGGTFPIVEAVRKVHGPPQHRLVAKLVLKANGKKCYLPPTEADARAYTDCQKQLATANVSLPNLVLEQGHNTKQALNYGYRSWQMFFNDRQLLALGWLHQAIETLEDDHVRDALLTVFSSTLEFNNLFASSLTGKTGRICYTHAHNKGRYSGRYTCACM